MQTTIPADDKLLEIPAGTTVGGRDLVITTDSMGYFIIQVRGSGGPHPIADQKFTSFSQAKRAAMAYRRENAALLAKEALKDRIVNSPTHKEQRKAAALALKNGELTIAEQDDED